MAIITPDTFNPLRRYVSVRLQQGVPLVDAEWNEKDDVRRFELRAYLKWFVGDGVADGSDAFRVAAAPVPAGNEFVVRAGVPAAPGGTDPRVAGLRHVGRCLVDGLDALIEFDTTFRTQPLHIAAPGAAATAALFGTVVIPELPVLDGSVTVYLDVWDRLVRPDEEPALVFPDIGTETCARLRREWAVRARTPAQAPVAGDADFELGHSYYALARVTRVAADPTVFPSQIEDLRERRLLTPPATLIDDVLGTTPDRYRRGLDRPVISLREAVNALLRGELPSTPDSAIAPAPGLDVMKRGFLFDRTNGLVAVWYSDRVAAVDQVFATRLDLDAPAAGFAAPPLQVTSGAAHTEPHAAVLPNGDLLVAYQIGAGAGADVLFKRGPLAGLAGAAEGPVANAAGVAETSPMVIVSGPLAVILLHLGAPANQWHYRRRRHTDDTWVDAGPQPLSATVTPQRDLHAAADVAGDVWAAFRAGNDVRALRLNPITGVVANEDTLDSTLGVDQNPFVLCRAAGGAWVFWNSPAGLHLRRFEGGAWLPAEAIPDAVAGDREPSAVEELDGGVWLFWTRGAAGAGEIQFRRRDPVTGAWAPPRPLTLSAGDDNSPFPLIAANHAIWTFWSSDRGGDVNLFFKRLVTAL
jgi:hypothetical protein